MIQTDTVTYKNFIGVANIEEAIRIMRENPNLEQRLTALYRADNVYIDPVFMIHTREGYSSPVLTGDYHSLWCSKRLNIILAVKSGNLYRIIPGETYTETIIKSNVGNTYMEYSVLGDTIYCTNNLNIFKINNYIANDLITPNETYKRALPAGHLIEHYHGQTYIAKTINNYHILLYSDPAAPERYDVRNDKSFFRFQSKITMLKAVTDGIFISADRTMFLRGNSSDSLKLEHISDSPAFEHTAKKIGETVIYGNQIFRNAIFWTSEEGIFVGGDGGNFKNLIGERYKPSGNFGISSFIIKKANIKQYITILKN